MVPNIPGTELTPKQLAVAEALGFPDDKGRWLTREQAYNSVYGGDPKYQRQACYRLLTEKPAIMKMANELRSGYMAHLRDRMPGIAVQEHRLAEKEKRHHLLNDLLEARQRGLIGMSRRIEDLQNEIANSEDNKARKELEARLDAIMSQFGIGEDTGLLAKDFKAIADKTVPVFRLDKALLDAINDLENDTAKEMGQIITKTQEVPVDLDGWDPEDLAAYERVVSKIAQRSR